jgi:hypothetical protein
MSRRPTVFGRWALGSQRVQKLEVKSVGQMERIG